MSFLFCGVGSCKCLEEDLKTDVPKKLQRRSEQKVRESARRGGAVLNLESLQALDRAIEIGGGGVWLELTEKQYRKLLG